MEDTAKKTFPLTRIQRLIGDRMLKSKLTKPCFYIKAKADMTELMGLRRKLGKSLGVKITSNTFLIRALALAAREFPAMLGRVVGERKVIADAVNVGFAVNSSMNFAQWRTRVSGRLKFRQFLDAFADQIGPETNKYVCAPCSNCKGQIRDLIGYYEAWDRCRINYGGLVELVVNAMADVKPGFLEWEYH